MQRLSSSGSDIANERTLCFRTHSAGYWANHGFFYGAYIILALWPLYAVVCPYIFCRDRGNMFGNRDLPVIRHKGFDQQFGCCEMMSRMIATMQFQLGVF